MKRGRKTLFNKARTRRICRHLRNGCDQKTACNIEGVGETTYHEWKNRGRSGEQPYAQFFAETSRARDAFKASLLKKVVKAADQDAKHAEWYLERGWPSEFARTQRIEQIGEKADGKGPSVSIFYDTQGVGLKRLLDFPNLETDSPKVAREKQARLLGESVETPNAVKQSPLPKSTEAPEIAINEARHRPRS